MTEILFWIETSALGQLMRESDWLFPMAEILHFVGLSLLIGPLMVVDLRLVGFLRNISFEAVYKLLPLSLVGFGINMLTGVLFCFSDPFRYYPNIAFRMKMGLVLLAGLNVLWFKFAVLPKTIHMSAEEKANVIAKIVAVLSLLIWFAVIVLGRMIPYLEE
jgi:uncharacterized protein DUF6644